MKNYWQIDGSNEIYKTLEDAKYAVKGNTQSDNISWLRNCYGSFPVIEHVMGGEVVSVVTIKFDTESYTIEGFGRVRKI